MALIGLFKRGGTAPKLAAVSEDDEWMTEIKNKILTAIKCHIKAKDLQRVSDAGCALEVEHLGSYTIITYYGADYFCTVTTFSDGLTWVFTWTCWLLNLVTTEEVLKRTNDWIRGLPTE